MNDTLTHVNYPHEDGRLYDCPACEARCHCDETTAPCVYSGPHNRPVWLLWHGGASYAVGYVATDCERFETEADAIEACASRYVNRDGRTPAVSDDAESHLFYRDPSDESDPYPDGTVARTDAGDYITTPA